MAAVMHHRRPEPGVTEIRVHGVGGTTPEALLEQTGVRQVTGDDKAGMYRGAVGHPGRTVEAYSWGGLTARSRSRAFWVLLLPFSLVNLAGWMVEPPRESGKPVTGVRTPGIRWHEVVVQLIAVCTTAMYVMWAALISMNVLAFQCGAIEPCRSGRWYMEPFDTGFFADHPGRRIVAGLFLPLGLLFLFWLLGRISRTRYDDYGEKTSASYSTDAAGEAGSLIGQAAFWHTSDWQRAVGRTHVAVVLAILAALLGRAAGEFDAFFSVDSNPDGLGPVVFWSATTTAVIAVARLVGATWASDPMPGSGINGIRRFATYSLVAATVLLIAASALTWRLEVPDARLVPNLTTAADGPAFEHPASRATVGEDADPSVAGIALVANLRSGGVARLADDRAEGLPAPVTDLWGFGWAPILLLAGGALMIMAFSAVQLWRWLVWRLIHLDQILVPVMLVFVVLWPHAPWVALGSAALGVGVHALAGVIGGIVGADTPDRPAADDRWRLRLYLAVCFLAWLVAWLTRDAPSPWGQDWPRMTPVVLFTAILAGMNLFQMSRGGTWNSPGGPAPARAHWVLALLPVGTIATGIVLQMLLGRDEWFQGSVWLAWVMVAVTWIAQFRFDGWRWNGPAAVAMLGLAITMGAFSGLLIWLVDVLDRDGMEFGLRATGIYEWLTIAFAAMLAAIVAGLASWYLLVLNGIGVGPAGEPADDGEELPAVVNAADVVITVASMLLVAGIAALILHLRGTYGADFRQWIDDTAPDDWRGIVQAATWMALGVSASAFFIVRNGLKDHGLRTKFGILWDVASFWPRTFHPFAPPSYAVRAVPELQRRVTEVVTAAASSAADPGDKGVSGGAAIVSGHSQGSLLSLAAAVTLRDEVRPRVRLVTHGSPIARLYQRFFPRYFPQPLLDYCAETLGPSGEIADGGWLNFWRGTDPIGGAVFGPRDRTCPAGYPPEAVATALAPSASGITQLPDVHLADPQEGTNPFELKPRPRGHSGYMADPAMWQCVDAIAADLHSTLDDTTFVLVVDAEDRTIGVDESSAVHTSRIRRHLAVSVLVSDAEGRLLIRKRSDQAPLFAAKWADSCSTHVHPGETALHAAKRCIRTELSLADIDLAEVGRVSYSVADPAGGGTENELRVVFAGELAGTTGPDPHPALDSGWLDLTHLRAMIAADPDDFAPWLARILAAGIV